MAVKDSVAKAFFKRKKIISEIMNVMLFYGVKVVGTGDIEFISPEFVLVRRDSKGRIVSKTPLPLHG